MPDIENRQPLRKDQSIHRIIVFGANSDLGYALAQKLSSKSSEDYSIVGVGRRSSENRKYDDFYNWSPRGGVEIDTLINSINLGPKDIALICPGVLGPRDAFQQPIAETVSGVFESTAINVSIVTATVISCVRHLSLGEEGGHVVLLSSVAAHPILNSNYFYSAAKQYVEIIVKQIRKEAARKGVRITVLRVAYVQTQLNADRNRTIGSMSIDEFAIKAQRKITRKRAWIPGHYLLISLMLKIFPPLQLVTNRIVRKSWK